MQPFIQRSTGHYLCFEKDIQDNISPVFVPDLENIIHTTTIRNMLGEKVTLNLEADTVTPAKFADYYLYVFNDDVTTDPAKASHILMFNSITEIYHCCSCGVETEDYYLDPSKTYNAGEDVLLYPMCEECWDSTIGFGLEPITDDDAVFQDIDLGSNTETDSDSDSDFKF